MVRINTGIEYTKLIDGCFLSKNPDSLGFTIAPGRLFFVIPDQPQNQENLIQTFTKISVNFPGISLGIPTQLTTSSTVYVYIQYDGQVVYTTTAPGGGEFDYKVCLGVLTTIDAGATILNARAFVVNSDPDTKAAIEYGIINANEVGLNPIASTMQFSMDGGFMVAGGRNYWVNKYNPHIRSFPPQNPVTFNYMNRNSLIYETRNTLNPAQYESSAGVLEAVPNNKYTATNVYLSAAGSVVAMAGQRLFNSLQQAEERAPWDIHFRADSLSGFALMARVLLAWDATDSTNSDKCRVVPFTRFGAVGEFLQTIV